MSISSIPPCAYARAIARVVSARVLTTERAERGFALVLESRGGTAGTKAARNTQYGDGLRQILSRLAKLGASIESVELATKQHTGTLDLRNNAYPIDLGKVEDVDALRREIQRSQGNNPTRRIRLVVSRMPDWQIRRVHSYVGRGQERGSYEIEPSP